MRIRIVEEHLYRFSELSEKAKDVVRSWYLEGRDPCYFADDCEDILRTYFPNSNLNVDFDLSYRQGDYFIVLGLFDLKDLFEKIRENFTIKEQKFFDWAFNEYGSGHELSPCPYRYSHYVSYSHMFEKILDYMETDSIRNIRYNAVEKFETLACNFIKNIIDNLQEGGYSYFYEIEDDELEEICEANGYEFFENGKIA